MSNNRKLFLLSVSAFCLTFGVGILCADPCGMVPPLYPGKDSPITRVGTQQTYVFFKNGIEGIVVRPGFSGKVDEFGMLIPFPSVPAIRKVADDIYSHLACAADPPEVIVYANSGGQGAMGGGGMGGGNSGGGGGGGLSWKLKKDEVRVIKEEAIGMYELATLEAGSAAALKKWMEEHRFVYPKGMDKVCDEYIAMGWVFVAEKTKVGNKGAVDPKPGMRNVDPKLPPNSTFDGYVQGMEFRFRVDKPIVPMRLSAYNEGNLRNILYVLTDQPIKFAEAPESFVRRQITGTQLLKNITKPLPVRFISSGRKSKIAKEQLAGISKQRDPKPHNGLTPELFASDLLAVAQNKLEHPHEEEEKRLLRINAALGLHGAEVDELLHDALGRERQQIVDKALGNLKSMTLTVVDGDFERKMLQNHDLTFAYFKMSDRLNVPEHYDVKTGKPGEKKQGTLITGDFATVEEFYALLDSKANPAAKKTSSMFLREGTTATLFGAVASALPNELTETGNASTRSHDTEREKVAALIAKLSDRETVDAAEKDLIALGDDALPQLATTAIAGSSLKVRGSAIFCLSKSKSSIAKETLKSLVEDNRDSKLARCWAAAAYLNAKYEKPDVDLLLSWLKAMPALLVIIEPAMADATDAGSNDHLIEYLLEAAQAQQPIGKLALRIKPLRLARVMLNSAKVDIRYTATGVLASIGQNSKDAVVEAINEALAFDPEVRQAPWGNGPLYLPQLSWTKPDAVKVCNGLMRWALWCERNKNRDELAKIRNAIQPALLPISGISNSRGIESNDVGKWLTAWRQVAGKDEIRKILVEQGVDKLPKYSGILSSDEPAKR